MASACVYVAAKVEESPVHVRSVCQEAAKVWAGKFHSHGPWADSELFRVICWVTKKVIQAIKRETMSSRSKRSSALVETDKDSPSSMILQSY